MSIAATTPPQIVTYCHCKDCKRWTGAPAPAFAGFASGTLDLMPEPQPVSHTRGVMRWFCAACGSPVAATFEYLPGQTFVPLGILDQAADLPPSLHCHAGFALPWLHTDDGLPRADATGRDALNAASRGQV
ncbi:GFA family protein [Alisedimentitalea sp. MJ-SS2]|uniref:GFA family protein n=1 Tax=Aliisedimentitalea sp. MJ-SS2 TaxID=3049795 RepID=UPI00290F7EA8|nr:GFA family protein [Alisedimentitalea sp. MJ-SS2]MDU8928787.1 GFA family protein [Alisedimentitalea sp. MJ-SS2]